MLTARGWWVLIAGGALALSGAAYIGQYSAAVPLFGLTLMLGVLADGTLFAVRWRWAAPRLRVTRTLLQGGRPVAAAWAGGVVTVRLRVELPSGSLPIVHFEDRPAGDWKLLSGEREQWATLSADSPAEWSYTLRPTAAGVIRFEGIVVRIADPAGFFTRRVVLREGAEYLVLPPLADDEGKARGVKRVNALPAPGVHRLRRAGSGSELLDLRDYRPGDAPKMVAWRASARRDRLIVKEFESDLPVRCVFFLDASPAMCIGPAERTPLARMAGVAAGAAQAAAGARDLVGLSIFDAERADLIPPDRSRPHLIRLLRALAGAAGRPAPASAAELDRVAGPAHELAEELYPDLLERDVNSRPLALHWRPLADSYWFPVVLFLLVLPLAWGKREVVEALIRFSVSVSPAGRGWMTLLALFAFPTLAALLIFVIHGMIGFWPPRVKAKNRRKGLAALFAWKDGGDPAAVERYLHDDEAFGRRSLRFLAEHRADPPPGGRSADEQRDEARKKVEVLARAIVGSVARARDNELYVIFADLVPASDDLAPLIAALRTARGRHHQAVVIMPWPGDVPAERASDAAARRDGLLRLGAVVKAGLIQEQLRRYADVRGALAKIGVGVLRADEGDAVRSVLDRLDRLRGVKVRR